MPPVSLPYTWTQTSTHVTLTVPLKSSSPEDITVADLVVKVNMPPFLLTLDLYSEIDAAKASVTLNHDTREMVFELRKEVAGEWPTVECRGLGKEALRERREESLVRKGGLDEARRKRIKDAKLARHSEELKAQMDVDRRQREALERAQAEEKARAQDAVFETFKTMSMEAAAMESAAAAAAAAAKAKAKALAAPPSNAAASAATVSSGEGGKKKASQPSKPPPPHQHLLQSLDGGEEGGGKGEAKEEKEVGRKEEEEEEEVEDDEVTPLPPPRTFATPALSITFTPRVFPSPLRESRAKEEEDWLARNYAKIRENHLAGKGSGNLKFVERDGVWLKAKGDEFVRLGDWDSACNAYSSALGAGDPRGLASALLYLNRGACHLRKLRGEACWADCTLALELLLAGEEGGKCPRELLGAHLKAFSAVAGAGAGAGAAAAGAGGGGGNDRVRGLVLKAISRRVVGGSLMGKWGDAMEDCKAALELLGGEDIGGGGGGGDWQYFHAALPRLEHLRGCESLKVRGDGALKGGDVEGALGAYTQALGLEPRYTVCRLNRSALYFGAGRWAECAEDCGRVLSDLEEGKGGGKGGKVQGVEEVEGEDTFPPSPPPASDLAEQIRVRATKRREEALKYIRQQPLLLEGGEGGGGASGGGGGVKVGEEGDGPPTAS